MTRTEPAHGADPCPFCGAIAVRLIFEEDTETRGWGVECPCDDCYAYGPGGCKTPEDAIERWNVMAWLEGGPRVVHRGQRKKRIAKIEFMVDGGMHQITKDHLDDILSLLRDKIIAIKMRGERIEDYSIVCGADLFAKITGACIDHGGVYFDTSGLLDDSTLSGLRIHIAPDMDGIAIVPSVAVEK